MAKNLELLDSMHHLKPSIRKDGIRKTGGHVEDEISKALNECVMPSEMGGLLAKLGKNEDDIIAAAKSSPNFGRFRMWVGNVARGIISRMVKWEKANPGQHANPSDFAYKKSRPASGKPAKKSGRKVVSKKSKAPRTKSATKSS